ncbi:MAG: hypothetical protein ABI388_01020, partial [Bacteroidia bacterium]
MKTLLLILHIGLIFNINAQYGFPEKTETIKPNYTGGYDIYQNKNGFPEKTETIKPNYTGGYDIYQNKNGFSEKTGTIKQNYTGGYDIYQNNQNFNSTSPYSNPSFVPNVQKFTPDYNFYENIRKQNQQNYDERTVTNNQIFTNNSSLTS